MQLIGHRRDVLVTLQLSLHELDVIRSSLARTVEDSADECYKSLSQEVGELYYRVSKAQEAMG